MLFPRRLYALLIVFSTGFVFAAPEPDPQVLRSWVKQLSADRFAIRENATRRLIALGPQVIDYLVDEIQSGGLEASTRGLTILRALALRDDASALRAEAVIRELASARVSSVAHQASLVLRSIEDIRTDRGIKLLSRVGATFSKTPVPYEAAVSADIYITFGKKWKGTIDDLAYIGWLTEFDRIHFTLRGEFVTDEWLERLANYPQIVGLQLNRAAISDSGMNPLRKLVRLELLSLRYDPLTDVSLESLKAIASSAPLRLLEVFGTQLTVDLVSEFKPDFESLVVRHRKGGFLGISGRVATEVRNGAAAAVGCYISSVQPNEAAARAGLRRGDVVVRYGDHEVTEFSRPIPSDDSGLPPTLAELIGLDPAGARVTVTILRGGEEMKKEVVLGEWP